MAEQMTKQELTALVRLRAELLAAAIRQLPKSQWGGWIVALMELLDPGSRAPIEDQDDFRAVLDGIARSIAVRLESGEW